MIKRLLLLTEKRGLVSFAACSFVAWSGGQTGAPL